MPKYNLTLSRWHKVAERIHLATKEAELRARSAFVATTISPWNKGGVEEKAEEIKKRALADLDLVETAVVVVADIRSALAVRNAQLGVSAKLGAAAASTRRAALYKQIIDGQKPDMVLPAEVRNVQPAVEGPYQRAALITLQIADRDLIAFLRAKLEDEKAFVTRLLDEVADINRERLELSIPEDVLRIAGLAG